MLEIEFANLKFRGLTKESLFSEFPSFKHVVTVNAEFIVEANCNQSFKKLIDNNYATLDGQIPFFFASKKYPNVPIEKISGSDFIYDVCMRAQQSGERVYLLGGHEMANRDAIVELKKRFPALVIEGHSPPFAPYPFSLIHDEEILSKVHAFAPHYLFVGFGAIKQERWITQHKEKLEQSGVKMCVGSGGTFEMVSGKIKRAPVFLQKIGLEGVYRFVKEPKLFRLKRLIKSLYVFRYIF